MTEQSNNNPKSTGYMKEGWEYKKLGEVCEKLTDGSHNPPKGISNSDFKMISSQNVFNNLINLKDVRYLTEIDFFNEDKRTNVRCGDVLLTIVGTIGRSAVVTGEEGFITLQRSVAVLTPKSNLISKFLMYCCIGNNTNLNQEAHGIAQKGIYLKQLKNLVIPVPPLSEQQRIVEELDLLSSIIEKKKAQLKELDSLAQSIFYDMFGDPVTNEKGWEVMKLGEISKEKLSYGSGASAIPYDGKIRYIRITDINNDGDLNEEKVSANIIEDKYILNNGDILFARSGATVGKTYCHKEKNGKCLYAGYLIRLVPNKNLVKPEYVFSYTKTSYYLSFVKNAQNAVAQPNINAKQYGNLLICLPPLSLQQQFAEKVEAIEHQKDLIKQSIKEVETLFNRRMDYYFDG